MSEDTEKPQPKAKGKPVTVEAVKGDDGVVRVVEYNPPPTPPNPPTDGTTLDKPVIFTTFPVEGDAVERKGRKDKA